MESFEVVVALFAQQVEIGENETIIVEDLVFVAERTSLETLQENGRGFTFSEPSGRFENLSSEQTTDDNESEICSCLIM